MVRSAAPPRHTCMHADTGAQPAPPAAAPVRPAVSNFNFSLEPFVKPWGDALSALPDETDDPRALFLREALDHMVRLSFHERVAKAMPPAFARFIPPEPLGTLAWVSPKEGDLEPGSDASLSAALLARLRQKLPQEEVTDSHRQ